LLLVLQQGSFEMPLAVLMKRKLSRMPTEMGLTKYRKWRRANWMSSMEPWPNDPLKGWKYNRFVKVVAPAEVESKAIKSSKFSRGDSIALGKNGTCFHSLIFINLQSNRCQGEPVARLLFESLI